MQNFDLKKYLAENKLLKEDEGYDYSQMREHFLEIVDELDDKINTKYPEVKGAIDQDYLYNDDPEIGDKEFEWVIDNGDQYVRVNLLFYRKGHSTKSDISVHVTLVEKFKPSFFKRKGKDKVIDQFAEHIDIGKGLFKKPVSDVVRKITKEIYDRIYNQK